MVTIESHLFDAVLLFLEFEEKLLNLDQLLMEKNQQTLFLALKVEFYEIIEYFLNYYKEKISESYLFFLLRSSIKFESLKLINIFYLKGIDFFYNNDDIFY